MKTPQPTELLLLPHLQNMKVQQQQQAKTKTQEREVEISSFAYLLIEASEN
jgi:hypothetical protein